MNLSDLYEIFLKHPVVNTDTRKISEGSLFFALKGPNFNANHFASQAINSGAAYAVIDDAAFKLDDRFVLVDDVLKTLQDLAAHHRMQMSCKVLAIVGSNGKTTTKELLTSVIQQEYRVLATPGNFNNHIGLPLTLLQLTNQHEVAIIEMGANHVGENAALCEIAKPDLGLITNNGKDHLEGFGSMEGVAQSNSELYYYLNKHNGLAFVNANDEWLMLMASRLNNKVTYAANDDVKNALANCVGKAKMLRPEIVFTYEYESVAAEIEVTSKLSGDYNFDNIMAAVCVGKYMGLSDANIQKGVEAYAPQNNRSQVIKKGTNTIYLDAYNANPSSLEASLRNFAAMPFNAKIAIVGDMFEMGKFADEEHRNMVSFCSTLNIEEVWFVGEEFAKQKVNTNMKQFATTNDVISYIRANPFNAKNIFMKGSRGMKLETLVEVIS